MRLKFGEYQSGGLPMVSIHRMPDQKDMAFHEHDFTELVIILGGCGQHFSSSGTCWLERGHVIVIPEGHCHGYRDTQNFSLVNLLFKHGSLFAQFDDLLGLIRPTTLLNPADPSSPLQASAFRLEEASLLPLLAKVDHFESEIKQGASGHQLYAISILIQILLDLNRQSQPLADLDNERFRILKPILRHIEDNLDRPLNISELELMSGLSASTLQRHFKAETALSVMNYINARRMVRAVHLLRSTRESITKIALKSGFSDSNYFTKVFHRQHGCSPRQYRSIF